MMENENLIECVRNQPHLWDKRNSLYKDIHFKERTWETISIELCSTALQCKTTWKTLRDKYRRELNANNRPSGSGATSRKQWPLMETMSFLQSSMESGSTTSNIDESSSDIENTENTHDTDTSRRRCKRKANDDLLSDVLKCMKRKYEDVSQQQTEFKSFFDMLRSNMLELPKTLWIQTQMEILNLVYNKKQNINE
ncbi:uncharacterized protein isoform X2 [Musca autumnalis]|uniref:uncharacterized protein isoform X2 n=1 Tax=Musca autumnalis TaxID=221902 RepID=UPI003CEBF8D9